MHTRSASERGFHRKMEIRQKASTWAPARGIKRSGLNMILINGLCRDGRGAETQGSVVYKEVRSFDQVAKNSQNADATGSREMQIVAQKVMDGVSEV